MNRVRALTLASGIMLCLGGLAMAISTPAEISLPPSGDLGHGGATDQVIPLIIERHVFYATTFQVTGALASLAGLVMISAAIGSTRGR